MLDSSGGAFGETGGLNASTGGFSTSNIIHQFRQLSIFMLSISDVMNMTS